MDLSSTLVGIASIALTLSVACGSDLQPSAPSTPVVGPEPQEPTDPIPQPTDSGVEVNDAGSSDKNCGWAGHDCRGLGCTNGVCNSELVSKACEPGDFDAAPVNDPDLPEGSPCGRRVTLTGIVARQGMVAWILSGTGLGDPSGRVYRFQSGKLEKNGLSGKSQGLAIVGNGLVWGQGNSPAKLGEFPVGAAGAPFPYLLVDPGSSPRNFAVFGAFAAWEYGGIQALDMVTNLEQRVVNRYYQSDGAQGFVSESFTDVVHFQGQWFVMKQTHTRTNSGPGTRQDVYAYTVARPSAPGGLADSVVANLEANHGGGCMSVSGSEIVYSDTLFGGPSPTDFAKRRIMAVSPTGPERNLGALPQRSTIDKVGTVLVDGDSVFAATTEGVHRGSLTTPGSFIRATPEELRDRDLLSTCRTLATDERYLYYYVRDRGEIRRVAK